MSRLSSSQRQQALVFVGLLFGAFGRPGSDLARDRRQVIGDGGPLGQEFLKLLAGETFLGATTVTAGPGGTTAAALQLLQVIDVIRITQPLLHFIKLGVAGVLRVWSVFGFMMRMMVSKRSQKCSMIEVDF